MNAEVRAARKKPVEVTYMVWPGGAENATPVIDWILRGAGTARYHELRTHDTSEEVATGEVRSFERPDPVPEHLAIDTLEGTMRAMPGDVIIRGVKGEFYPCKPDVFAATYDRAGEPVTASAAVKVVIIPEGEPFDGPVLGRIAITAPPEHVDEVQGILARALNPEKPSA